MKTTFHITQNNYTIMKKLIAGRFTQHQEFQLIYSLYVLDLTIVKKKMEKFHTVSYAEKATQST